MTNYTSYTPQQAHDDITALFDAYYDAKKAGDTIPPNKRIESADAIVEHYVEVNGERPPKSILSRLATYILLDTLTDSHPDKMSRDEYPIMSESQEKTRRRREQSVQNVYTGEGDAMIGRYIDRKDGVKRRIYDYMTPAKDTAVIPSEHLSLYEAIEKASLSDIQREIILLLYVDGVTQAVASSRLGVSQARISQLNNGALDKIREYLSD